MASSKDFYSNKDSNQNRKLEQIQSFQIRFLSWTLAAIFGVGFIYYYYNFMERPPLYPKTVMVPINMNPPAPMLHHYAKQEADSHIYDPYKTPYEQ